MKFFGVLFFCVLSLPFLTLSMEKENPYIPIPGTNLQVRTLSPLTSPVQNKNKPIVATLKTTKGFNVLCNYNPTTKIVYIAILVSKKNPPIYIGQYALPEKTNIRSKKAFSWGSTEEIFVKHYEDKKGLQVTTIPIETKPHE